MKIGYLTEKLDIRGTCRALYDYANFAQQYYDITPLIISDKQYIDNDKDGFLLFSKRFQIIFYEKKSEIDGILKREKCDILYFITYGTKDNEIQTDIFTCIHCVFDLSEPYGDVYAAISETMAKKFGKTIYVPHMISLIPSETKENLRKELNIPENAIIFGRHGGMDTFHLIFVFDAIKTIVNFFDNIYFIFVNTQEFYSHPKIRYIDKFTDIDLKNKYINTLDAYIEAGTFGHSFGLAIAEASINNKPIIVYDSPLLWNRTHIDILGKKGIYFTNRMEFMNVILTFNPKEYRDKDMNCYRKYSPQNVMKKFYDVFVKPYLDRNIKNST